jgi:hypothetical protein
MALLVCTRCYRQIGAAAQERVNEAAEAKQILQRAGQLGVRCRRCRGFEVRPFGGNQRLTSVRQNEHELQAAGHASVPEDFQRLPFERMMRAGDGRSLRELLTVGSVWWFPSTTSTTTF